MVRAHKRLEQFDLVVPLTLAMPMWPAKSRIAFAG